MRKKQRITKRRKMAYKSQNDLISKFQLSNNFLLQIAFKIIFNSFSIIFLIIFTILFCYDYKKKTKNSYLQIR